MLQLECMKGKNRKITIQQVYEWSNIRKADREARKGKRSHYGVRVFDLRHRKNLRDLRLSIINGTYKTSKPTFKYKNCDHKTRVLSKVHYPDHVAHHALMQVILPVLERSYYYESAASIKGRGIHYAQQHVRKFIDKNKHKDLWYVHLDFVKFYHNVVRQKLYDRLCKEFNDPGIRKMLHDVIWALRNHNGLYPSDGSRGVGIGLYPIQPLVNFYLNDLDREISKFPNIKMFRYCDDILIIGFDTKSIQNVIDFIIKYAKEVLDQPIHTNIGIQKLDQVHPISFVGYKFYKQYTFVRNSIKKNFKNKLKTKVDLHPILASYKGWLERCNGLKLWKKLTNMSKFSELNLQTPPKTLNGKRVFDVPAVSTGFLVGREISILDFETGCSTRYGDNKTWVLITESGRQSKFCTGDSQIISQLESAREQNLLPFDTILDKKQSGQLTQFFFT